MPRTKVTKVVKNRVIQRCIGQIMLDICTNQLYDIWQDTMWISLAQARSTYPNCKFREIEVTSDVNISQTPQSE